MTLSKGELLYDPEVVGVGTTGATITFVDGSVNKRTTVLKVPDSLTSSYTITFPTNSPTAGYFLQTDVNGQLSWATVTAAAAGSSTQIQYNNANVLAASANFTYDPTNSIFTVSGPNTTTTGEIRLPEASTNGSNYIGVKSPTVLAANNTYTLPTAIGTAGQVLKLSTGATSTAASLEWGDPVTGSATAQGASGDVQLSNGTSGFSNVTNLNYSTTNSVFNIPTGTAFSIGTVAAPVRVLNATTLFPDATTTTAVNINGTVGTLRVGQITSTGNLDVDIAPAGSGGILLKALGTTSPTRLVVYDNDLSNAVTIQGPTTLTADYTLGIPNNPPEAFSVLSYENSAGQAAFISTRKNIIVSFDGGGNTLQVGQKGYAIIYGNHVVQRWTILADTAATLDVNVTVADFATWPTTTQFSNTTNPCRISAVRKAAAFNVATGTGTNATNALWTARGTGGTTAGWLANGDVLEFTIAQVGATPITATYVSFSLELLPVSTARTF